MIFEVSDDSGFLGIFNPTAYESFVDEDWQLDQLIAHFIKQINRNNLIFWGTGAEGIWNVEISKCITCRQGFREFTAFINVSDSRLCLINYESLSMGAQFSDIHLPEPYLSHLTIPVDNGLYKCRIVQLFDPEVLLESEQDKEDIDFLIEMEEIKSGNNDWMSIQWFKR